ncbi:MAG TPA: four helix bundle protein [Blastocatellia bacterium]|nr:four helix bundle protein [Blastocatellia bacterium]
MSQNVIQEKSYSFALRIVRLYKHLCEQQQEFVLSRYLLAAGTAIGARVKAAQEAESKTVFVQEMSVALQKASETEYWLQLLHDGGLLDEKAFDSINTDCVEVKKLLVAIVKSARKGQ